MTGFDFFLLAALVLSITLGFWHGFVYTVMSLLGWVVAFFATQHLSSKVSPMLTITQLGEPLRNGLAYVLVFVGSLFVWAMLSTSIKKLLGVMGMGAMDRLLGALFGLLRGVFILLLLMALFAMTPLAHMDAWQASRGIEWGMHLMQLIKPLLPENLASYLA